MALSISLNLGLLMLVIGAIVEMGSGAEIPAVNTSVTTPKVMTTSEKWKTGYHYRKAFFDEETLRNIEQFKKQFLAPETTEAEELEAEELEAAPSYLDIIMQNLHLANVTEPEVTETPLKRDARATRRRQNPRRHRTTSTTTEDESEYNY